MATEMNQGRSAARRPMALLVAGLVLVAVPLLMVAPPAGAATSMVVKEEGITFTSNGNVVTFCRVALEVDRDTDAGRHIVIGTVSNQSGIPDCAIHINLTITYKDPDGDSATAAVAAPDAVQLRLDNAASSVNVKALVTWTECNAAASTSCGKTLEIASK